MERIDDYDVVQQIRSGNSRVFALLVRKYETPLLRVVCRYVHDAELAQDIVQEGFFKTYKSLARFEHKCSFKNWLYKITLNTAKNKIRSRRWHEDIEDIVIAEPCVIEEGMIKSEVILKLKQIVETLPDKQRQSLQLRVFEDMSFKQVADIMDCPYDTAKANYRHAMLKVRELFKGGEQMLKEFFQV